MSSALNSNAPFAHLATSLPISSPGDDLRLEITFPLKNDPAPGISRQRNSSRRILRHERERKQRRRAENLRIIRECKAAGCWLCGRTDLPSTLLHFHHVDPASKRDAVAHFTTRSTSALISEINKCRLLCFKDHQKHHEIIESEAWRTGGCYDL